MKCCAMAAPEMNHFRPVMVQAPPRRSARVRIIPGSEPPPGAGSVIAKDELTAPAMIGRSQRAFWSSRATAARRRMLPSSGAAQLKMGGPKIDRFDAS